MPYSLHLADRIVRLLEERAIPFQEKRMMGGLCILVDDKMLAGIIGDDLMARVGPDAYQHALTRPGCREMDLTGRPLTGLVLVEGEAIEDDPNLDEWLQRCLEYNPQAKRSKKRQRGCAK